MKTKTLKRKQKTQPGGSLKPVGSVALDEFRGELLIIEYRLARHIRNLRAEADGMESTSKYIANLDGRLFPPNDKLRGGGPLSNKTTEADTRRPLE